MAILILDVFIADIPTANRIRPFLCASDGYQTTNHPPAGTVMDLVGTERLVKPIAFFKLTVMVVLVGLFKAICHTGPEIAIGDECDVVSTRVTWTNSSGLDAVTG